MSFQKNILEVFFLNTFFFFTFLFISKLPLKQGKVLVLVIFNPVKFLLLFILFYFFHFSFSRKKILWKVLNYKVRGRFRRRRTSREETSCLTNRNLKEKSLKTVCWKIIEDFLSALQQTWKLKTQLQEVTLILSTDRKLSVLCLGFQFHRGTWTQRFLITPWNVDRNGAGGILKNLSK